MMTYPDTSPIAQQLNQALSHGSTFISGLIQNTRQAVNYRQSRFTWKDWKAGELFLLAEYFPALNDAMVEQLIGKEVEGNPMDAKHTMIKVTNLIMDLGKLSFAQLNDNHLDAKEAAVSVKLYKELQRLLPQLIANLEAKAAE